MKRGSGQLVADLLRTCRPISFPRGEVTGNLTISTCRDGLLCRIDKSATSRVMSLNVVWHWQDTTFVRRPITAHGCIMSLTSLFCASFNMRENIMSNLIFNSANLIGITTGSLNATELAWNRIAQVAIWLDEWYVWAKWSKICAKWKSVVITTT